MSNKATVQFGECSSLGVKPFTVVGLSANGTPLVGLVFAKNAKEAIQVTAKDMTEVICVFSGHQMPLKWWERRRRWSNKFKKILRREP